VNTPGAGPGPARPARRPAALADLALHVVAGVFVVVLLGTVTAGIVFRALNEPLSWTDEAAGYLMVWLGCLGWMIATRRRSHIRIRYFLDKLSGPPSRAVETLLQAGVALFGAVVAWYSVHLAVAWMYVPLLPAGLLTLVQALVDIARLWRPGAAGPLAPAGTASPGQQGVGL
jgi:TRAP-type C4-dicarboxylate transport system permease small subunit